VNAPTPRLSVILVTDRYATVRKMVACLGAQSHPEEVELVFVAPADAEIPVDAEELQGFAAARVVGVDAVQRLAPARAAGVRAATAPLVYLAETHAFPQPGFVESVLAAHEEGWNAVVPGVGNANPGDGARSWSILLLDYGDRLATNPPAERTTVGPHNAAFERALLLQLNGELATLLAPGSALSAELRRRGARIGFRPDALIDHVNVSRPVAWAGERFAGGVILAQARVARWSLARRLLYAGGSPLIPLVWLSRTLRVVRWREHRHEVPLLTLPLMLLGTVIWALGECAGYLGAGGDAEARMSEYELNKLRYATRVNL
jgi:hypothetical protein